ncbi:hypothetical protein N7452_003755 [Penicillium brevicompactum]|uniref:Heterokaryon incompatibility domain-containing protein n=1 Tax=Penicillium brevicompactum TaxID=5074 RepID=A0A9W9QU52_PENBR|nr:hypothetical protein N7452_003755 [Penicillium brevicompactum]
MQCQRANEIVNRFGSPDQAHHYQDILTWRRGTATFWFLKKMAKEGGANWQRFSDSMSREQAASWRVLDEWTYREYGGALPHLELGSTGEISIQSMPARRRPSNDPHKPPLFPSSERMKNSVYSLSFQTLFAAEFLDTFYFKAGPRRSIQPSTKELLEEKLRKTRSLSCDVYAAYAISFGRKEMYQIQHGRYFKRQNIFQQVDELMPSRPWLDDADLNHYPVFLWDTETNSTVHTGLASFVRSPYVCVSHTWGRYKKNEKTTLPGCPHWEIPKNSIFEIKDLPRYLQELAKKTQIRYVWFDLVCIPQTREEGWSEIYRQELGNQAAIFKGSSICVAWFNYIDDWKSENMLTDWMTSTIRQLVKRDDKDHDEPDSSKSFLKNSPYLSEDLVPKLAQHPSHAKFSITYPVRNREDTYIGAGSPWFTSLWTLQEALLCPHVVLMSRNWTPLTCKSGIPITLDQLCSLSWVTCYLMSHSSPTRVGESYGGDIGKYNGLPNPVDKLLEVFTQGGILPAWQLSRTRILAAGSIRRCTRGYGEAIMSALNLKEWYYRGDPKKSELVLGTYPLGLVEEVAKNVGPEFALNIKLSDNQLSSSARTAPAEKGSMLPFGMDYTELYLRPTLRANFIPVESRPLKWHPVFDSWKFNADGSVRMTRAVLVGWKHDDNFGVLVKGLGSRVFAYYHDGCGIREDIWSASFEEQIQRLSGFDDHTVCFYVAIISRGVGLILKGYHVIRGRPVSELWKVGCFIFDDRSANEIENLQLQPRQVDWTVV